MDVGFHGTFTAPWEWELTFWRVSLRGEFAYYVLIHLVDICQGLDKNATKPGIALCLSIVSHQLTMCTTELR
jgi:hypothetical protein